MCDTEDELHFVRYSWAELTGDLKADTGVEDVVRSVPGVVCIDAKSIYDCLINRTSPHGLLEKRTALELMAYLKNTRRNGTTTRWIHGEANPADGLTKINAESALQAFLEQGKWTLVYDPECRSAKKRRALGLRPLEQSGDFNVALEAMLTEIGPHSMGQDADVDPWFSEYPKNL